MKYFRYLTLGIGLAGLLFCGCSKKKEDAAKLEQEMLNQDSAEMAAPDTSTTYDDSAALIEMDATAIPEEETGKMPQPKAMPMKPAGDGYSVQVAGCEDESYARYLVELYTERGYEPFVSEVNIEGQTYYRVRIGLFDTYREATRLQAELKDRYSIHPWVDQITQ